MKPDWTKAPTWAQFLAQDRNGKWFWYEARPTNAPEDAWLAYGGSRVAFASLGSINGSWWKTLELRA